MDFSKGKMFVYARRECTVYGNYCSGNGAPNMKNYTSFETIEEAKKFMKECKKKYNGIVSYTFFHSHGREDI